MDYVRKRWTTFWKRQRTMMIVTVLMAILACAYGFYLPGVAPVDFVADQQVEVLVNKLDSVKTQLPYDYYSLPFCEPVEGLVRSSENLGEYLEGDRIENSPYVVKMKSEESCKLLCRRTLNQKEAKHVFSMIKDEYSVNMISDNMPAFTKHLYEINGKLVDTYEEGYALGFTGSDGHGETGKVYFNNHIRFNFHYHEVSEGLFRTVGFEVEPHSIKHTYVGTWDNTKPPLLTTCASLATAAKLEILRTGDSQEVVYTYDVTWIRSDVKWASRWDMYLKMTDSQIHWFSILNSMMVVVFLSIMISMILIRTLRRDLARYNQFDDSEEAQAEDTGWKLVHGDVFRPPVNGGLLATLVGSGAQVLGMALSTLTFALLGFLSPANRGGLMSATLLLYVFMGIFAGYTGTRIYTMLGLQAWKANTFLTAVFFPGINFTVFFILNLFVWAKGSTRAIPFFEMFALLVLWFGISVPLVYLGSYIAYKKDPITAPVKVNQIPRLIPDMPYYMSSNFSMFVGGVLPFGAVFIELFFILTSIWMHRIYYVFGFLFLVFVILILTCIEITIVMCYFQLCSGDYKWWWRSFFTSGSSAFYLFVYSAVYFATRLDITNALSGLLYFGYMALISFFFFVMTGTAGFVATLLFVRQIYASVKLE